MDGLPADLLYHPQHEWVRLDEGTAARVGLTAYAVDQLRDIVYVSLPTVGTSVVAGDPCAEIESTKAYSNLVAPISGVVTRVNDVVVQRRDLISREPYGDGWLFEVEMGDHAELDALLGPDRYAELIAQLGA